MEAIETLRHKVYYPKPKSKGGKAMTAIAGFRCNEGVILCADSELNDGFVKTYANKIRMYGDKDTTVRAALTGAGEWDDIQRAMDYAEGAWPNVLDGLDFVANVESKVKEIYAQKHDKGWDGVSMIAAYWKKEPPAQVFKFTDTGAVRIRTFACDGVGSTLSSFLAGTLYGDSLSLRHGICLAAYILYVADKFAPECGGLGNILTITDKGSMEEEMEWDMQAMREFFGRLPSVLQPIILEAPDNTVSPASFSEALQLFTGRLTKLRKQAEIHSYDRAEKYGHLD